MQQESTTVDKQITTAPKLFTAWFYLIAVLAGSATTLAFAPVEWRFFSILTPAILFLLLSKAETRKQYLLLSYSFGVGMFATGVSWIFYSMYFFAHAYLGLALALTSLFVLFMALFMLIFAALALLFRHHSCTWQLLLYFPASWVIAEWVRGWLFTGFPWLYLGHSHIDNWLVNIAPVTGSLGVSFLSAVLSGALALMIPGQQRQRLLAAGLSLAIFVTTFWLGKIDWTAPVGKPITAALLQGNIPQDKKWLPEYLQPTLDLYLEMTHENWDADLIIWPETAIPGYFHRHMEDVILPLQEKSAETNTDLLMGGFYYNEAGVPGAENSILAITPESRSIYSKHHLVPFSEYIPFLEYIRWLESWIQLPYDSVKRGAGPTILEVAGVKAQMSVCYEDVYGDETIESLPEATMLINVSNDGWFTGSIEPYQHMEIARMRSVETGRYMLRATNIGVSGIINEKGKITATAPAYKIKTIRDAAQPLTGATPFVRMGNALIVCLMLAPMLMSLIFNYRKQRRIE